MKTSLKNWVALAFLAIFLVGLSSCGTGKGCGCPKFSLESSINL